jgi:hypothetical protein
LQDAARAYSAKLVADGGTPLEARVGINTGEVVVRTLTRWTYRVHPDWSHRQSCFADAGDSADGLDCDHWAHPPLGRRLLSAQGARADAGQGLSEAVDVHEVTGLGPLRTRLQRSAGRGLTKFVGREREMEALRHAAEQAKSGRGQIVTAMAEPGIGKTFWPRLLIERTPPQRHRCRDDRLIHEFAGRKSLRQARAHALARGDFYQK